MYPCVTSNRLANFSTLTKGCENCARQVVLLQYTSHYLRNGNCDQWSSWSTFPEIIIIMLEKESMHSAMTELAAIRRRLNG
jgi:hypothetical protein